MINKSDLKIVSALNYKHWLHLFFFSDCNAPSVHRTTARSLCTRNSESDVNSSGSSEERTHENTRPRLIISSKNRKMTRRDFIAKYQEEKLAFGELHKTSTARNKTKSLGKATKDLTQDSDSELAWILKYSQRKLRKIRLRKDQEPDSELHKNDEDKSTTPELSPDNKACEEQRNKMLGSHWDDSAVHVPTFSAKIIKTTDCDTNHLHNLGSDENIKSFENFINLTESEKDQCLSMEESVLDINYNRALSSDTKQTDHVIPKSAGISSDLIKNLNSFPIFYPKVEKSVSQNSEALTPLDVPNERLSSFPSVTKILHETMSPNAKKRLLLWEKNMIEKLGLQGFELYKKELLNDGSTLHACIRDTLLQKDVKVPAHLQPSLDCLKHVFDELDDVTLIESNVFHPVLQYKGVVDCVVTYRGKPCVIDWKKSNTIKSTLKSTFDAPIQIAAYIGAINVSNVYPFTIENGLVVIANTAGEPANVHEIDAGELSKYWRKWLQKLRQYHTSVHTAEK